MSKVGRKDPEDPRLRNAQLVFQVGLRKDWSKQCSYWIEIYRLKLGNSKSKAHVYHVYRQWSFLKRADGEIIDGGINSPPFPSLTTAERTAVDYLEVRQEKGDIIEYLKEADGWPGIAHRVQDALGDPNPKTFKKVEPQQKISKFKEAQLEREKKANW